jgi:gliding motility-associated-like protein
VKYSLTFIFLFLITLPARSQVCQGSLGDPIVNLTFGSGSNPGPALSSSITSYPYLAADCPNDGSYTIRNNSTGCFNWHNLPSDHSGGPGGYFMLVNASYQPSVFFLDTVNLVCSNMNYVFSAWIVNMNKPTECGSNPNKPNLSFSIEKTDGTILQTFNTGDIPPQASISWREFGFFFNTPVNVSRVVLKIKNNAAGGCGNDLALDDISFRPCGPLITASVNGSAELLICEKEDIVGLFEAGVSPDFIDPFFQWEFSSDSGTTWSDITGANSPSYIKNFSGFKEGVYLYRAGVSKMENSAFSACRFYSPVLSIRINSTPEANAGPDKTIIRGQSVQLSGSIKGNNFTYAWSPPEFINDIGQLNPIVNPDQTMKYALTAVSDIGCGTSVDSVTVKVYKDLFVPTAFTPDNNGKNDKWFIQALSGFSDYDIKVFDRYGQLVYHSRDALAGWDGKFRGEILPSGVFIYLITINKSVSFKGTVAIIR